MIERAWRKIKSFLLDESSIVANATPIDSWPTAGVYFLIRGGRVTYVGQSVNVISRIGQHRREADQNPWGRRQFDAFYVVAVPVNRLRQVEAQYICALEPEDNQKIPSLVLAVVGGAEWAAPSP